VIWLDAHRTKYPIIDLRGAEYRKRGGFVLLDSNGDRISFHRTKSGALRKRRELLEQENT
jgi:hypothetical protein